MKLLPFGILVLLLLPVSYSFSQSHIQDAHGRTLILHGLNTSSGAKHSKDHQPWITESDVDREYRKFGFNCVRYLIFWGAFEPEKGIYDTTYLAKVKERVKWYTDRKMYVILDMHQDVYGYGVGGNGAPEWACSETKIKNLVPDKWAWWLQNMEPKVIKSYAQFWKYKKRKDLQDHYIACWQMVIREFLDDPYVIGYDLMNEPHGGKLIKTLTGGFEKDQLELFYRRLIYGIREVDRERYIFFEPRAFGVNFGMPSHLPEVYDAMAPQKLVYAPHFYPKFIDVGGDYKRKQAKEVDRWFEQRDLEKTKHKAPVLVGEFGLSPNKKGFDKFLRNFHRLADARHYSWTYWSNDRGGWSPLDGAGKPTPILPELLRVYPRATAGELISYSYDPESKHFAMEFIPHDCDGQPTEIAIPPSIYANYWELRVEGAKGHQLKFDPKSYTQKIYVPESGQKVSVKIFPKNP